MRRFPSPIRRGASYANIVSVAVILTATVGTSYGAVRLYTGAHVKDATLTGADVANGTLGVRDLSTSARTELRGRAGAPGDAGAPGPRGPEGPTGARGDQGKVAHSLVRYASYNSTYLRGSGAAVPNPDGLDWDHQDYPDHSGATTYPNFSTASPGRIPIDAGEPVLVQLTGQNQQTTGTIQPRGAGLLSASATLTVIHLNHDETLYSGGSPIHSRIRCKLRYANNGAAITAGSNVLGAGEWLSSWETHKVHTITITGSEPIPASTTANYNVGVSCVDADRTSSHQWLFVAGTVTAHAVYTDS